MDILRTCMQFNNLLPHTAAFMGAMDFTNSLVFIVCVNKHTAGAMNSTNSLVFIVYVNKHMAASMGAMNSTNSLVFIVYVNKVPCQAGKCLFIHMYCKSTLASCTSLSQLHEFFHSTNCKLASTS